MIASLLTSVWQYGAWAAKWSTAIFLVTPLFLIVWFYLMSVAVHVYRWRKREVYEAFNDSFWDGFRMSLAAITEAQGKIWHNMDFTGLNNLPKQGGALLVGYHGALPLDAYYFLARCVLERRKIKIVVDKFLYNAPGLSLLMRVLHCTPGTINSCVSALNNGEILMIYPGGLRESLLSDESYKLIWKSRLGFSRVALEAEVPIIPFFTENIREAARSVKISSRLSSWLYEKTRLPIIPIIGIFPVELKMHFGRALNFDDEEKPSVVADIVTERVQGLIQKHQRVPGSILRELYSRFWSRRQTDREHSE